MLFRFWYEFIFGIITLISVLIFGEKGMVAFVPIAFVPLIMKIKKIKPDEREKQFYYQSTEFLFTAFIFLIIICTIVFGFKIFDVSQINDKLLGIIAGLFIIIVSSVRLFFFYKK
jgi:hypothetical protein